MGRLEQHKKALFTRAGEEEKELFNVFVWLFDASFTWPLLVSFVRRVTANFAALSNAAFEAVQLFAGC